MRAKKRLGQHFLSDPSILNRIVDALDPGPEDTVLEIGPGTGGLTEALARRAGRVVAIERDRDLIPRLGARLPAVEIVAGDALTLDWPTVTGVGRFLIAGNIPYNITTPLLEKALAPPRAGRATFLVQREVGERVAAAPGGKSYGALSVGVQVVAHPECLFRVPPGAFRPPPRVDSVVLRLDPLARPLATDAEVARFRSFTGALFARRRKQLQRSVRQLTGWPAPEVKTVLEEQGITPEHRVETLAPGVLVGLFRRLVDLGWRSG